LIIFVAKVKKNEINFLFDRHIHYLAFFVVMFIFGFVALKDIPQDYKFLGIVSGLAYLFLKDWLP